MRIVASWLDFSIFKFTYFLHVTGWIRERHAAVNLQANSDGNIQEM